ncbi:unnamed protein product [Mesocestoides corti]|uniref:Homeobox domain-containing protein n=2 Tax=Mesocestoides corti TaxID=53468 RepID=A0A0R3UJJ9_MESCO|nr:unnamed protein product [Mesocestoides corti]
MEAGMGKRKEQELSQGVTADEVRTIKKPRLVFTDIQRRTLHAIFKETKRPSKEMQATIAHQLGLEISTVANFFMNARRRSSEKWQDGDSKNSSMIDSSSPQSSIDQSEGGGGGGGGAGSVMIGPPDETTAIAHAGDTPFKVEAYGQFNPSAYVTADQSSLCAAVSASMVSAQPYDAARSSSSSSSTAMTQAYMQPEYPFSMRNPFFAAQHNLLQQQQRLFPYAKTAASNFQAQYLPAAIQQQHQHAMGFQQQQQQQQQQSSLIDLRRLASASQIDPRFLATATELSASHQSLRDQALEICSNMNAAAAAAAASVGFNAASGDAGTVADHQILTATKPEEGSLSNLSLARCGPEASNIDVEPQTTISDAKTDCIRHEAFDLGATNRSDGGSRSEPLQSSFFSGKLEQAEQQRESTRPVQTRKDKNEENVGEFDGSTSPIFKHPTLTGDRDERDQQKRFQKQLMQHEHLEAQLAETRRLLRSSEDEMKSIRKEVQETEHRLTQELAKKVTSLRDLEGRFVKMSAELQMSLLDSQAKNRVLEDTLKTNQSLFRRAVSERDSMQKAKAMLSFRLQVAQDQIRELEHKLNSSASCSESQMARLNRTLEGVAEVAVAARHASARIRSTLKQAGTSVKIATPSKAAKQSFETSVVSSIRQLTDDVNKKRLKSSGGAMKNEAVRQSLTAAHEGDGRIIGANKSTPVLIERRLPSKEVASSKVGLRSSQDKLNSLSQRIDASRRSSELEVTSDVNQRSAEVISRPAGDEQVNANNSFSWSHAGHSHCVRAARMGFNRGSSARRSDRYSRLSMNQSETGCSKRSSRLVPDTSKSDKIGELLNKGITKADRLRDVIGRLRQFIHTTRPLTESWDKKENRGLTQSVESGSHPKLPNSISHNGK